jgi:hypothetical protein
VSFVHKLSPAEVERLGREDENTIIERQLLDAQIEVLTTARRIAQNAVEKTKKLQQMS